MEHYKRVLAWILTLVLVLGMFPPMSVSASEAEDGQPAETTVTAQEIQQEVEEEPPESEPTPETTAATVPETTAVTTPTEATVPETTTATTPTEETVPETTETTEPTEETVPETTEETVPETTAEEPQEGVFTGSCAPDAGLPDSQELTDRYIYQLFFGGLQTFGTAGRSQLGTEEARKLYDHLKAGIEQIAVGARSSALFQMDAGDLGIDLTVTAASEEEALAAFDGKLQFTAVLSALLHDCPYELYWYDKTTGARYATGYSYLGNEYTLTSFQAAFQVAGNHQAAGYDPENPAVDTALANRAVAASSNAKNIVTANAGKSDYEKLTAYKEAICGLVSYNTAAAGSGSFSQDDAPWQLIYVFDQDPSTNVVCEGYSKAFQYLCDGSSFTDAVCYTVTGTMNGGGHMWNIVRLEGKNYLADVTNSDDGSVGQNGGLFLSGAQGSAASGYTALDVSYVYDGDTLASWGEDVLTLSNTDYTQGAANHVHRLQPNGQWNVTATFHSANCADCGQYVNEDHVFNGDTCTICGYQNHAHTLTWMDKSDYDHWGGCSGCGVIVHSDHSYDASGVCPDCGILRSHAESHEHHFGNYQITPEWHCAICDECGRFWNNGENDHDTAGPNNTCSVCGYDTNHVHNLQPNGRWNANATQHSANCADCGIYVDEDHVFNGDTCSVCGYQNHAHTWEDWINRSNNDHDHWCTTCHVQVHEDHSYVDGVCTECGILESHAVSNQHNIVRYEIGPDWHNPVCEQCGVYYAGGDNSHDTAGENGVCSVCGYDPNHTHEIHVDWVDDRQHHGPCAVGEYVDEDHIYNGDDTCDVCGYKNHDHAYNWVDKNDDGHWGECAECKMIINGSHSYGDNGVCTLCGALREHCESHQHNFSSYQIDPYSNEHCPVCDECGRFWGNQDNHHTPDASGKCTVCGYQEHAHVWSEGQTYSEESFHAVVCAICGYSEEGGHSFDESGACQVCGYKQHAHVMNEFCMISNYAHVYLCAECGTEFDLEHVMEGDTCVVCGYRQHEHTGSWQINPRSHFVDCVECGARFFENHVWNADGTECTVCGCKNHVHTPGGTWTSYAGYHMGTCTDCGSTEAADHVWRDGRCVICGYKMHDHTVSSWSLHPVTSGYHQGVCTDCGTTVIMRHDWDATGLKCATCGYQAEGHAHRFGNDLWINTKEHRGTCIGCQQFIEGDHTYAPGGDTCTVCGYVNHEHTFCWVDKNDDDHWGECSACGMIINGDHTYINDVCSVCGIYKSHAESHQHNFNGFEITPYDHCRVCDECGRFWGDTDNSHDTAGENSVCSVCGYDTNHVHNLQPDGQWNANANIHSANCTVCGQYVDEDHVFNGDTCTVCGYQNHDHAFLWMDKSNRDHWGECSGCGVIVHSNEHSYENGVCTECGIFQAHAANDQHNITRYEFWPEGHNPVCEQCGRYYDERHGNAHIPDENGVCTVCGYDPNHAHRVEPGGVVSATRHGGHCSICGEFIEEEHRFVDGKCEVCGYQNHEHNIVWIDKNDNVHWSECSECGYIEDAHSFDANGVCTVCGIYKSHAESHQHNDIGYVAWHDRHDPVCQECERYLALENSEHTPDASGACTVCGYQEHQHVWDEDASGSTADVHYMTCGICGYNAPEEPHDFGGTDTCQVCGYKQHAHVMNEFCLRNDFYHIFLCTECGGEVVLEHVMEGDTCTVCGYRQHDHVCGKDWIRTPIYHYTDCGECGVRFYVEHVWNEDNTQCTVCGYQNHEHTYPSDAWEKAPSFHEGKCADCGGYMNGEHVWKDGQCTVCGYTKHDHTVSQWSPSPFWNYIHEGHCTDCGATVELNHDWDATGLKCTTCGYQAEGHTHSFGSDLKVDAQTHKGACIGCGQNIEGKHTVGENGTCTVCGYAGDHEHNWGYRSSSQGHTRACAICGYSEKLQAHTFNSKKTCTVCGYKEHEHAYVPGQGSVSANDDQTHYLVCGICGEHVGDQPHAFQDENGVETCSVCGYMIHEHKAMGYNTITETQHRFVCAECGYAYREDHTFDPQQGFGKICTACGYNTDCDHTPVEWHPNGDAHESTCKNCGLLMNVPHEYDEIGICAVCGYDGNHQHDYVPAAAVVNHTPTCACGATLPWEDHIWKGNKCLACGYQKHTHTVKAWEVFFRYPQTSHIGTCAKCGATIVEMHTFDVTGVCTVCDYARKERHDYTVTYVLGGGANNELNPASYWAGESFDLQDPTWPGYIFDGWYTGADYTEAITGITEEDSGDITVYAKWLPVVCEVVYDLADELYAPAVNDPANPVRLYPDTAPSKLKKPTRTGYTFDGWTMNNEPVTELSYEGSGTITVTANWTPLEYKITYKNVPSTVENLNPDAVTPDDAIELRELSRSGYDFQGWYTSSKFADGTEVESIEQGTVAKLTLYARWQVHTYTVEFDANDESYEGTTATGKMTPMTGRKGGSSFTLKSNGFKRAGSVFQGWNTEPDGTGYGFPNKAKVTDLCCLTGDEDGTITLYAQWVQDDTAYSIMLKDGDTDLRILDANYGTSVKLTKAKELALTRNGYTFAGWNTEIDGTGIAYKDGASVKDICAHTELEVSLYAQWKPVTYKISYTMNGGKKDKSYPTTYMVENATIDLTELPAPTRTGYHFEGWYTNSKFTGDPVTSIDTQAAENVKLYAKFEKNTYTLRLNYYDENGQMKYEELNCTYGKSQRLPDASKERDGFTFLNWVDENGKIYKNKASVKNLALEHNAEVTLTAQWAKTSYTLTFDANGGSGEMASITGIYGKSVRLPANTLGRRDCTFLGWNTEPDGSGKTYKNKSSVKLTPDEEGSAKLYAQWASNTYTVVFDANCGDAQGDTPAVRNVSYSKGKEKAENGYTRPGYTFTGWNTRPDGTGKKIANKGSLKGLSTDTTGVVRLYAQWKLVTYKISYSLGGGKNPAGAPKTYNVNSGAVKLPTPTRKGYDFAGWSGIEGNEIPAGSTGNRKLTAVWIKNS